MAFDSWLLGERERWRQQCEALLQCLFEEERRRTRYDAALRYARQMLKLTPWNEEAHRQAMLLLAWTGQRSAALEQVDACRQMLNAALDVASLLGGNLSIDDRRTHEMDLLRTYHTVLMEHDVRAYSFAQCLDDYRLSILDGFIRMVIFIGGDGLTDEQARAHREIIWPRFCTAILDLNVDALLLTLLEGT